jgi:hypothetical protein
MRHLFRNLTKTSSAASANRFPGYHNVDDCFLIGLPWQQVSEAVSRFVPRLISVEGLEIPRSTGVPVVIPVTFRRELCDLP